MFRAIRLAALLAGLAGDAIAQQPTATGTGFFVNAGGWVLTNAHVVEGCARVAVPGHGTAAGLIEDRERDLAAFRVGGPVPEPLPFRDRPARLAESVTALGYPLSGLLSPDIRVTTGTVNALGGVADGRRALQISAPIQPGNSGGPLIDATGTVLGVIVATLAEEAYAAAQNVNFAIPADVATAFLAENGIAHGSATARLPGAALPDVVEATVAATVVVQCFGSAPARPTGTAATPPRPPAGLARIDGHDIPGFDLRSVRDVGEAQCAALCTDRRDCRAFTYNTRHRVCFLKSDALVLVRNADAVSGYAPELESELIPSGFTVRADADSPGGDYARLRGSDFIPCFVACLTDDRCRAFAYVRARRECWLKDRVGRVKRKEGVELGLR